ALDVRGYVLGHLHDGCAVLAIDDREGGDAEDLPVRERHLALARVVCHGAGNHAGRAASDTKPDVGAGSATERRHLAPEVGGECLVAAQERAAAVEYRNRI